MSATQEPRYRIPLLEMSERETGNFKTRVFDVNGIVPLLANPFCRDRFSIPYESSPELSAYIKTRDKHIKNFLLGTSPMVIFEESAFLDELSARVPHNRKRIYYVDIENGTEDNFKSSLLKACDVFEAAGVRTFNFGGVNQNEILDTTEKVLKQKSYGLIYNAARFDDVKIDTIEYDEVRPQVEEMKEQFRHC